MVAGRKPSGGGHTQLKHTLNVAVKGFETVRAAEETF